MQLAQSPAFGPILRALKGQSLVLYAFASTLFVSALLLFSIQPMFARMVVPQLGGSPSVWAVAMCFFQAVLLLGYCYAHLITRFLTPRFAIAAHLAVCALAFTSLPIAIAAGWEMAPGENTQVWLLGLFAVSVGLPFFAVSANAPLLQSWFARTDHPHGKDPYFLYGASNIGSMVALLGYPTLIEPLIGLAGQSHAWTAGFAGLALMIAACGSLLLINQSAGFSVEDRTSAAEKPAWRERLIWIALAFVPSGLLVAFTTHITTDVASAPFLWIGPLALYLLTYILVFRDPPRPAMPVLLKLQPVFVFAALMAMMGSGLWLWLLGAVAGTGAFFTTAMICHRTIYERRPDVAHLTEFYLFMSLGGVLGGIFTALLAPVLFSLVIEYPMLLVLGLLCRRDTLESTIIRKVIEAPVSMLAVAVAIFAACKLLGTVTASSGGDTLYALVIAVIAVFGIAAAKSGERIIPLVVCGLSVFLLLPQEASRAHVERSFFGVHRVLETADGQIRLLSHGTTIHGAQRLRDAGGNPVSPPVPASYYHPRGPMARLTEAARANGPAGATFRAGIVGLGAGAMTCYAQKGDHWRFFEIDRSVIRIAQNPKFFDFMSTCQPGQTVVEGDARLTISKEPARSFDYLLIDAFSSDTIPVHLMTVEAVKLFLSKVSDNGLLVFHISNRYLDLEPVLEAAVAKIGGGAVGLRIADRTRVGEYDAVPSQVVVIARSKEALKNIGNWPEIRKFGKPAVDHWTDDYSNILTALIRKFGTE